LRLERRLSGSLVFGINGYRLAYRRRSTSET
jgi:hypothetical protein